MSRVDERFHQPICIFIKVRINKCRKENIDDVQCRNSAGHSTQAVERLASIDIEVCTAQLGNRIVRITRERDCWNIIDFKRLSHTDDIRGLSGV